MSPDQEWGTRSREDSAHSGVAGVAFAESSEGNGGNEKVLMGKGRS